MKLLIIGAGGHGRVVREIAEATGMFEQIDFADDNYEFSVGKIDDIEKLHSIYDSAFVGIGNNKFRSEILKKLSDIGYNLPVLIHPTAFVSKSAAIGEGTVIEPKAVVNADAFVGKGCIISIGSLIDHDVRINDFSHINSGAVICDASVVESYIKIDAGEVISKRNRGYSNEK